MPKRSRVPVPIPIPRSEAALLGLPEVETEMPLLAACFRDPHRLHPAQQTIPVRFLGDADLRAQITAVLRHSAEVDAITTQALARLEGSVTMLTMLVEGAKHTFPQPPALQVAFVGALEACQRQAEDAVATLREAQDVRTHEGLFLLVALQHDAAQGNTERRKRRCGGQASGATRRARSPREISRATAQTIWQRAPTLSCLAVAKLIARTLNTTTEQTIRRAISDLRPTP